MAKKQTSDAKQKKAELKVSKKKHIPAVSEVKPDGG